MKFTNCNVCSGEGIPLNSTLIIDDKVHCSDCLESHYPHKDLLKGKYIQKLYDSTVCHFCKTDFDAHDLDKLGMLPTCDSCRTDIAKKTFPLWVKGFMMGIVALVVVSFAWNWKYFSAYYHIQDAFISSANGDYKSARSHMEQAGDAAPEVEDISLLTAYFKGVEYLNNDKYTQAITELKKCEGILSDNYDVDYLLLTAHAADKFDSKDYKGFLEYTKVIYEKDSTIATINASMASAYACIYASGGGEEAKIASNDFLQRAKKLDPKNEDKVYYNAIEYRLATKNIIDRKAFQKKFPNGWSPK